MKVKYPVCEQGLTDCKSIMRGNKCRALNNTHFTKKVDGKSVVRKCPFYKPKNIGE